MAGEIYLDGTVTPTSEAPISNASDQKGGWRQVADAAERNAIPAARRVYLMPVQQQDTQEVWILSASPPYAGTDSDWTQSQSVRLYVPIAPVGVGTHTVTLPATHCDVAVNNSDPDMDDLVLEIPEDCPGGTSIQVKDSRNQFGSRPTTITPLGGEEIQQLDGSFDAALVLDTDGLNVTLRLDFGKWVIL